MKRLFYVLMFMISFMMIPQNAEAKTSKMSKMDKTYVTHLKKRRVPKKYGVSFYTEKDAEKEEKKLRKQKKWKDVSEHYSVLARDNFDKGKYVIIKVKWTVVDGKKGIGKLSNGKKIQAYDLSDSIRDEYCFKTKKGDKITSYVLMFPFGDKREGILSEDIKTK